MASRLEPNSETVKLPGHLYLVLAKAQAGGCIDMPPFKKWTLVQNTIKTSLDTMTQVCENIFLSQIIDLIEQVSKLFKTPVYKC